MHMCRFVFSTRVVLASVAGLSVLALSGALFAQLVLDLSPCVMCIYQRVPFIVAAVFGALGLSRAALALPAMIGAALAFAVNTGLAIYHTGIEQAWWDETSGCVASFDFETVVSNAQNLLERISTSQAASCADIPWTDPVLGLSMANYNIGLCLGLMALCIGGVIAYMRRFHDPSA